MAELFDFNEESQEDLRAKFLEARGRGIGGSDIGVVLGESPYKTRYALWLEKTKRVQAEDISGKYHVQRGISNEPVARAKYEEQTGLKFEPTSWTVPGKDYLRCNDDGYNKEFGAMLEIKCMGKADHSAAALGIIPVHYHQQLQYNMGIAKANIGYFISYRPEDKSMHVVTVYPDLDMQKFLMDAAEDFWLNHVVADVPPDVSEDDYAPCLDPDFEVASERYKKLKAEMELIKEELDVVETVLHGFLGSNSGIKQNGITISRVVRAGNVDYKKIPQLEGVDLEPYRKPSTTYIKITGERS
jgi:putative phage-type endonuclease